MAVPLERAEHARAVMLDLFPQGFEEVERGKAVELVAYTDAGGEERLWHVFGGASGEDVPAGWAERWRTFHRAVRAGRFWIGPPWEDAPSDGSAIVIEPGRAFGTGAHPTTQLCLELLAELPRGSLVDAGCGSGVVAIAAAKLGFVPVWALDDDPAAVEAASANAKANGVEVDARRIDVLADELPEADVAVANITLAAVEALVARVVAREVVTSGYLEVDRPQPAGWTHVERRTADGWAADRFRR